MLKRCLMLTCLIVLLMPGGAEAGSGSAPRGLRLAQTESSQAESPLAEQLLEAAYDGELKQVQALVAKGVPLTTISDKGTTLLMAAAMSGNVELAAWLLSKGQKIGAVDSLGNTPLMYAVWDQQLAMAKWLVGRGADVRQLTEEGVSLLMVAAQLGDLEMARWLLEEQKLELEALDVNETSPLLHALWKGHLKVAKYLASKGADVHETWGDDSDLLMYIAPYGHLDLARWLIEEQGLNLHARSQNGGNALFLAAQNGHLELVKYLIAQGASPHRRDHSGNTLLIWAAGSQSPELVSWLLALPLSPNARNAQGETALDRASDPGIISLLEAAGGRRGISGE